MADLNNGLRILIVEDSPDDHFLVSELLKTSVLKIQLLRIADTLAKAIDFLSKDSFDIILLDLTLPDSSGIDTFKNIKEPAGKTPVVILSGVADSDIAVEAIIHGAQDYHIKGEVDDKILTRAILYSIERKRNSEDTQANADPYVVAKKARLDLVQNEEITRQIMHGALDAIICIDAAGKITVWNPQAEQIFNWKQEETLGKDISEIIIPVEHRARHIRGIQHYLATGEGPMLNKLVEITALNRDGNLFPIELTIIPLMENGNRFFCAFIRDISERKKAEETIHLSHQRLKNAELIGKTGYWHWDVRAGKVTWSEGTYNVFGETQGNFKETFEDFIRRILPGDQENTRQSIQQVYENKQSASYGFWIETPLGDRRYVSTTAEVILDINGEVSSMFGTTLDDTIRKLAREKEKRDIERKQVLAKLNEEVSRAQVPEEIYELALSALQQAIQTDKASILLFDENGKMRFVACRNLSDKYKKAAEGHSPWMPDEKNAKPIFITDVAKEPGLEDLLPVIREEGICAIGFIPLIHQQKLLGKFMVYFTDVHRYDEDEVRVIQDIAANVAFAISEKKSALALRESEEKYRTFFENSMDGILLTTTDGQILTANPAACQMFGMTEKEICLAGRKGLVDVNDIRLSSLLQMRQDTNKAIGELNLVRKDGSIFPAELSSAVFTDSTGNKKTSMIIRDITQRRKNEQALIKNELYLRGILHSTNDGILAIDNNGKVITANKRLAELWRIPQELLTQNDDNALLAIVVGQLADPEAFLAKVQELYKSDQTSFDTLFFKDDRVFERFSTPLLLNEIVVGRVWSFTDVTRQKKYETSLKASEENLRQVLSSSADNFYAVDKNYSVTIINEAAERNLEIAWGKPVKLGTNILSVIPDNGQESIRENFKKAFEGERIEYELQHTHPDLPAWVLITFSPVSDDSGNITGVCVAAKDIAERKIAEENMRRSESQLLASIENTPNVAVQWYNRKGEVLFWNRASENIFGWKPEQAVGKTLDQLIHTPEAAAEFVATLKQVEETGQTIGPSEFSFKRRDGSDGYCVSTIFSIPSVGGEPRFVCMDVDITQRKLAEQKLKSSEERYRSLVEQASDGILVTDTRGNIIDLNSRLCSMFGYSMEEAMNKSVTDFLHPDNIKEQPLRYNQLQGDQALLLERVAVHKDGTIFDIELNTRLIGDDRTLSVIRNVSERKKTEQLIRQSEERYRTLVENAPEALVVFDAGQKKFVSVSDSATKLFKMTKEELLKIGPVEVSPEYQPDGRLSSESAMEKIGEAIAGGKPFFEWMHCDKYGNAIACEVWLVSLPSENKMLIRGSIVDITVRKKAEQMIKESEERYRTLVEHASDPILIYSLDGKIVDYNNAFMTVLGYEKKDLEGLRLIDLLFGEDLKENPLGFGKIKKGMSVHDERRARRKDGSAIPVELNSKMMPDGNIMVIARDVTERKKAEEEILKTNARFEVLSKATSDIIWDWDLVNDVVWWNDNYYSLLGIKKEKEFTGIDHWYNRIHPDDLDRVRKGVEKARWDNSILRSHEYRYAKEDGTYLHFLDRSFVMRSPDGQPYRMIGSMVDMTPIYAAQKVVAESENRLRTIYETEPECIKLLGTKGELLDMNPAGLAMIEADDLEIVRGKPVVGVVATPYKKAFEKLTRDVFKGKPGTLEFEIIGLKGTHRWLETHAVPMRDSSGSIIALLGVTRNITERKLAEEAVKQSEEKYRTIIEQAPDGIFISNKDTFFVDVNKSGCSMLGYTKEELLKMKFTEVISPESLRNNPIKIDELNSGKVVLSERTVLRKDGSEILVEINAKLRPDGMYQSFIRDITDRKKAEQAVKESEEKYRTLVEQAVDAIALYDASGKILDVNTGSVKLLGYSKKELTQMSLSDVLTKDEIKKKPVRYDVLQKGESTVKQRIMRRKDGSEVQTEVRSQQLPDGRFLSVIRDLTERVTSQEQIKKEKELSDSIINSLPGLFYLIDETGKEIRWNKLKEDISGYTSEEISRMENCLAFFEGSEKELVRQRIKSGFETGSTDVEAHLVTKTGKKILFYFTGIAIEYEGKKCMIGTGIDISDRKKAEMELEESYSAIRKLTEHLQNIREEERTHIAREIHDELGQKLTVLKMDISWINKKINTKEEAVKTRMKELLGMLDETVKAVRRISSDLRPSLLDDLGLTAAMEWQLHEFEKRFSIRTSFNSPDFGTTLPEAMKTGLFRIFQESLTNVARHSKAKKVTVTLNRENGSVILSVADDGVGFDKENVANKKTLGILGMKERTSMIGGSYEIISKPGKGTQIVVTIPFSN